MAVTTIDNGYYLAGLNDLLVAEVPTGDAEPTWISLKDEYLIGFSWTTDKTNDTFTLAKNNNATNIRTGFQDTITFTAKRCVGGAGQKLLLKKDRETGSSAEVMVKAEIADGSSLVMKALVDLTAKGTNDDSKVTAPFEGSFSNADEDPVYTAGK